MPGKIKTGLRFNADAQINNINQSLIPKSGNISQEKSEGNTKLSLRASEDTQKVMNRFAAGESVELDEINKLDDIINANINLREIRETFKQEHKEFANIPLDKVGTYLLNTQEREQLRN